MQAFLNLFRKSTVNRSNDASLVFDDVELGEEPPRKNRTQQKQGFGDLPQSDFIFNDPGASDFAERWGASSVNATRMFILSMIVATTGAAAWFGASKIWNDKKVVTLLVEVNGATGEYKKPVRIDTLTATEAMIKFGLSKWSENVFTIDPKMSLGYLQDADAMSKGRAKGQFAEFRFKTEVLKHIKEEKRIVFAKSMTVDILQTGVAIVMLETNELDPNGHHMQKDQYRIRLDYTINPPTDEKVVLRNPIGLEIEGFTYERIVK